MTLDELQWMCELFQTKNMSKAVENLYISQPALSQCLRRIEHQLGFRLFDRSNRGLEPTPKGELFYETAQKITGIYQDFLAQASRLDKEALQTLHIGLPPYLSMMSSTNLLKSLSRAYPNIAFSVSEAYTKDMKNMLFENQLQIMVANEPTQVKGAVSYPFGPSIPIMIYLRKNSPAAQYAYVKNGYKYLDPIYLADEPFAITRSGQATREAAEAIFKECGFTPHLLQETRHINNLYSFAKEGISSAIGPITFSIKEMDQDNHLVYRIPESYRWSSVQTRIYILPEVDRLLPHNLIEIIKNSLMYESK